MYWKFSITIGRQQALKQSSTIVHCWYCLVCVVNIWKWLVPLREVRAFVSMSHVSPLPTMSDGHLGCASLLENTWAMQCLIFYGQFFFVLMSSPHGQFSVITDMIENVRICTFWDLLVNQYDWLFTAYFCFNIYITNSYNVTIYFQGCDGVSEKSNGPILQVKWLIIYF